MATVLATVEMVSALFTTHFAADIALLAAPVAALCRPFLIEPQKRPSGSEKVVGLLFA
ncbi:hypothetical protein Acsp01_23630 [Actinoplanes sp. NBRC 101535]|nr:hypothetical protein Acsp01_23630 [Actinoplanes sp. NBRC 101535]